MNIEQGTQYRIRLSDEEDAREFGLGKLVGVPLVLVTAEMVRPARST